MRSDLISVIGCGRWGTFIAGYLCSLGFKTSLYGREGSARFAGLVTNRENEYMKIPDKLALTSDPGVVAGADIIVISVDAQSLYQPIEQLAKLKIRDKTVVLCVKGLEISTGRRLSQVASDGLDRSNRVAVWVGPGHVEDFCRKIPNCMVIDSDDEATKKSLAGIFSSDLIRFYYGADLIGNEVGAAAKNVYGIASGMLDGYGLSSLKGALMSRGTREISRLIVKMGGSELSAYGLCHLGDYEATLFSAHSRNRAFGECFVTGKAYGKLAEGYYTVRALVALGEKYGEELPICRAVYAILYDKADAKSTLNSLFSRSLKGEFEIPAD